MLLQHKPFSSFSLCCGELQVHIAVKHVFSVEFDAFKRDFIMRAHCAPDAEAEFHLFEDVSIFDPRSGDEHYCHTCGRRHKIPSEVDVLVSGPSCKNLSRMNAARADFHDCALAFPVQYSTVQ